MTSSSRRRFDCRAGIVSILPWPRNTRSRGSQATASRTGAGSRSGMTTLSPFIAGVTVPWHQTLRRLTQIPATPEARVSSVARRAKLIIPAGAVLTATVLTLALAMPGAGAQQVALAHGKGGGKTSGTKGDNGTVKIHNSTTPITDRRNEPHVCVFYLDAFGFDPGQSVSWQIESWPPTGDRSVVSSGVLVLDGNGAGFTGDMT